MVMAPALLETFCSAVFFSWDVLDTVVPVIDAFCVEDPAVPIVMAAGVVGPAAMAPAATAERAKKTIDFMMIPQKKLVSDFSNSAANPSSWAV